MLVQLIGIIILTLSFSATSLGEQTVFTNPKVKKPATKIEAQQCISWLLQLDKLDRPDPILNENYIANSIVGVAMDSEPLKMKLPRTRKDLSEIIISEKPNLESCEKAGFNLLKLEMIEGYVKSPEKQKIPDQIVSCYRNVMTIKSIGLKKKKYEEIKNIGFIETLIGHSIVPFDKKFKLKERIIDDQSWATSNEDDLTKELLGEFQKSCNVFLTALGLKIPKEFLVEENK